MTLKQFKNDSIFRGNYIKIRVVKKNSLGFVTYYCPFSMVFVDNLDNCPFFYKYCNYDVIHIINTPKCLLIDIYK